MSPPASDGAQPRREFVKETAAVVAGGVAALVPVGAALVTWMDPLRRTGGAAAGFQRVTTLDALPADGVPRKFTVTADRVDAWTRMPNTPVGAIYLRRTADREVTAFQTVCPHAGCFVDFRAADGQFLCPCHNSTFAIDGSINDPKSPSPRPLDTLAVELRDAEVWVRFEQFQSGHRDKRVTS